MFEKESARQQYRRFNADFQIGALPLENLQTINGAWGLQF